VQYLSALHGNYRRRRKIREEWYFDCRSLPLTCGGLWLCPTGLHCITIPSCIAVHHTASHCVQLHQSATDCIPLCGRCRRCSDPTECGSFISAVRCFDCQVTALHTG
jgi:hypothetical protein